MSEMELLKKLTALDFMAVDLQLYLNTHPDDTVVLEKYNSVIKEADTLRCQYEKNYGPLFSFRSYVHSNKFNWIDNPWPWERDANFKIEEDN